MSIDSHYPDTVLPTSSLEQTTKKQVLNVRPWRERSTRCGLRSMFRAAPAWRPLYALSQLGLH